MPYHYFNVIILAAGLGTRMISNIPKVLHQIAGKTMLQHLIDSISTMNVKNIYIVYNNNYKQFIKTIILPKEISIHWVLQVHPKGTGHAVQQVLPMIHDNLEILILYGDVPLISNNTLKKIKYTKSKCDICLLTANIINPTGYGRVIRNKNGNVVCIIEESDIKNNNHKKIKEINSGIFMTTTQHLKKWVKKIKYNNTKNELYLTDIIHFAYQDKHKISTINPTNLIEIIGINNKLDLIHTERLFQKNQATNLIQSGVIISDPNRFDLRGTLTYGTDVYIDINVIIEGNVSLGNRVHIGAHSILKNVIINDDVMIQPFSIIENSKINFKSKIGPFTRIRPGTQLQENTCIGNFVELKNTKVGKQSKIKHLSYLGDTEIGSQVNIGAGTITCNYDGINKHKTYIKDHVFIGANSQLIAPITIGKNAIIGAGTTVTKNVKSGETIISRIRQFPISKKIKK